MSEEEKKDTPMGLTREVKFSIAALSASVKQLLKCAGLLGHWVSDTVSLAGHKQAIVTLVILADSFINWHGGAMRNLMDCLCSTYRKRDLYQK